MDESYTCLPTSHLLGSAQAVVDEGRCPTRYEDPGTNMEGFPQNNGGERGRNNHTLESPSETFEQQPASSWKGDFSISSYTQYFNVDTDVVINRSMSALSPLAGNFFSKIDANPDLYGPIWIATTLVFALTALGNCATYLMEKHSDTTTSWSFDVSYMNVAACSIYGYVIVVPLGFYFLLQYLGSGASLVHFWCMWGYSLSILILSCEPVLPGCFLMAKAIGLMPMIDQGEKDDKIIVVCADDPEYRHYNDIKDLSPHRLQEIRRFFEDYKKNENKEVNVNEFLPASTAFEAIQHSMDLYATYIVENLRR